MGYLFERLRNELAELGRVATYLGFFVVALGVVRRDTARPLVTGIGAAFGVVSVVGHLVGPRLAELIAAVESGDLVKARAVNESLLPVYTGIFRTQGVIMVKAALRELGLPGGPVRPPLVDATPEQIAQLRTDLAAGGINL